MPKRLKQGDLKTSKLSHSVCTQRSILECAVVDRKGSYLNCPKSVQIRLVAKSILFPQIGEPTTLLPDQWKQNGDGKADAQRSAHASYHNAMQWIPQCKMQCNGYHNPHCNTMHTTIPQCIPRQHPFLSTMHTSMHCTPQYTPQCTPQWHNAQCTTLSPLSITHTCAPPPRPLPPPVILSHHIYFL